MDSLIQVLFFGSVFSVVVLSAVGLLAMFDAEFREELILDWRDGKV